MNATIVDPLLVVVLLLNFHCLIATRLRALIYGFALQGVFLGLCYPFSHVGAQGVLAFGRLMALTVTFVAVKGWVIPRMLLHAMREAGIRWRIVGLIGFVPSLLLGAVGTGMAMLFAASMPLEPSHTSTLVVPASLATVWTGFLLLTTRKKALTQVLGYLVLENGIFIFGLLLVEALPMMVEIGALLDLFVGVFVMGIVIHHISREFPASGEESLSALRE